MPILLCPSILLSVSIEIPLDRQIVVENVWRAMWKVKPFSIRHICPIFTHAKEVFLIVKLGNIKSFGFVFDIERKDLLGNRQEWNDDFHVCLLSLDANFFRTVCITDDVLRLETLHFISGDCEESTYCNLKLYFLSLLAQSIYELYTFSSTFCLVNVVSTLFRL